jgi:hypothetical protein
MAPKLSRGLIGWISIAGGFRPSGRKAGSAKEDSEDDRDEFHGEIIGRISLSGKFASSMR